MKKGFSLLEVILVVGIASGIFAFSAPLSMNLYKTQILDEAQSNYISTLQNARHNAVLQKNDSAWGVKFYSDEHCFVMFQGAAPASCDPEGLGTFDEQYDLISGIVPTGLGVSEGIIFAKRTGYINAAGTTTLTYGNLARGIIIEGAGTISKIDATAGGNSDPDTSTTCTSFTYSDWSVCSDGTQTETVVTSSPAGCTGGNPVLSQSCTVVTAPDAPTIGTATAGNATSSVTFTAPASDGGSAITSYTVTSSPGGLTGTGASSPITVSGLTNGTSYTFTVTATNAIGTSVASGVSNAIIPTVTAGLISYWSFDGNANDSFGVNNGTVTGATLTTGTKGVASTAYSLNGTTDYITLPNSILSSNGTISVWIKANSVSGNPYIWVYDNTDSPEIKFHIVSNVIGFTGYDNSAYQWGIGTAFTDTVSWHHIVGTWENNNVRFYLDNNLINSDTSSAITHTVSSQNRFGYYTRSGDKFNGSIDQVRVYNRALTATEVTTLYDADKPTVPGAPTIGTATAGNTQATVTYTAPTSNGGSTITSYTVTSNPGGISTTTTNTTSAVVTGLTNGTAYTFTVTATNAVGISSPSSASNSVTPDTAPGAPTIGTATAGNATSTVTFTAPVSNGGSAITGYTVTSSPAGGTDTNAGTTGLTHLITGLTNGTAYTFTVTATNAAGTSAASAASNSVTPVGLIAYWSFDGNANDSFGVNNGTVNGATLTAGTKGIANTAYSFNGSTDYINMSSELTSIKSYSFWMKANSLVTYAGVIGTLWRDTDKGCAVYQVATGEIIAECHDPASYPRVITAAGLNQINQWNHVVVVADYRNNLKLYINNILTGTYPALASYVSSGRNFTIAPQIQTGMTRLNGVVDEVRVYNKVLSTDEITALYNQDKP